MTTDNEGWQLVTSSPFPGAALITEPLVLLAPLTLAAEPVIGTIHSLRTLNTHVTRTSPR